MPTTVRFMTWNIANFSAKKKNVPDFYEFVTQTAAMVPTDFLAVLEVVSFLGETLGDELGGRLINFGKWLYQDSDQFAKHSEQVVLLWDTKPFPKVNMVYSFKDTAGKALEFPNDSYRAPHMAVMDIKGFATGVPVVAFHGPNPSDSNRLPGCANLAKIAEVAKATSAVVMGDFNVDPADPSKDPGLKAFGDLIKLGFQIGLTATATSLKASAPSATTFDECCSSQYDNFFYKVAKGSVKVTRIDVLTDLVKNPTSNYSKLFYAWYGSTAKAAKVGWSGAAFKTMGDALAGYRAVVSDHVPVVLALTF